MDISKLINIFSRVPSDKLAHFFGSSVLFTFLMLVFENDIPSSILTVLVALAKEVAWDGFLKKGTVDIMDFVFSCLPVTFYFLQ